MRRVRVELLLRVLLIVTLPYISISNDPNTRRRINDNRKIEEQQRLNQSVLISHSLLPQVEKRRNGRTLTFKPDTDPVGHVLNTLRPESLVELRVEADVLGAHRLLRKIYNGLDGPRSALLERAAVHPFVEVDRVLASHDIVERGALAGLNASLYQFQFI